MSDAAPEIEVTFSVPQSSPMELAHALRDTEGARGYALGKRGLETPDGVALEVSVGPQDGEFATVVCGGSRRPTASERRAMEAAPTLLTLIGRGGTREAALRVLRAGGALVHCGASGAFVRNSGAGHSARDWQDLADDPSGDGAHWAYVVATRDPDGSLTGVGFPSLFSSGMHVFGHRDVVVPAIGDDEMDYFQLHNYCGYLHDSGRTPVDGDVLTAMTGGPAPGQEPWEATEEPQIVPMFRVRVGECEHFPLGGPMYNPYGMYVLHALDPDDPESMEYQPTPRE